MKNKTVCIFIMSESKKYSYFRSYTFCSPLEHFKLYSLKIRLSPFLTDIKFANPRILWL